MLDFAAAGEAEHAGPWEDPPAGEGDREVAFYALDILLTGGVRLSTLQCLPEEGDEQEGTAMAALRFVFTWKATPSPLNPPRAGSPSSWDLLPGHLERSATMSSSLECFPADDGRPGRRPWTAPWRLLRAKVALFRQRGLFANNHLPPWAMMLLSRGPRGPVRPAPAPVPYESRFPFLSLPAELRLRIYKLLLVRPRPLTVHYAPGSERTLGILGACKVTYREAAPVLYGQNRLDFTDVSAIAAERFLRWVGARNADSVRHIAIHLPALRHGIRPGGDAAARRNVQAALAPFARHCPGLRTVTLTHTTPVIQHLPPDLLRYAAEGIRHVLALEGASVIVEVCRRPDTRQPAMQCMVEELGWRVEDNSRDDGGAKGEGLCCADHRLFRYVRREQGEGQ